MTRRLTRCLAPLIQVLVMAADPGELRAAPVVGAPEAVTADPVEKYARFGSRFEITGTTATNMFFPHDASVPPGVAPGTGITVDALLLPPGESNWTSAKVQPCFWYQPVEEAGSGTAATFLPSGTPEWRVRFAPDIPGTWQYKVRATDAGGTSEGPVATFACADSDRKGFVRVSPTDPKWMEFSDGTPFVTPLINVEDGNPLNGLSRIRTNMPVYGANGVRFVRWFVSGEGSNYAMYPFGDWMLPAWGFGSEGGAGISIDADAAAGKKFSFVPYYYSGQSVPGVGGAPYRLSLRAKVTAPSVLRIELLAGGNVSTLDVPDNGDWNDYVLDATSSAGTPTITVNLRHFTTGGTVRVHSVSLRRDVSGSGDWGPNLLAHPDSDSYSYVDQRHAALLDEVFRLAEEHGVYQKITITHKNDQVLGRMNADGTINATVSYERVNSGADQPSRWYQEAWWRYVVARWSYSTSLHSVEFANENDPNSTAAYNASWAMADYFHANCPRPMLISNSFWHSFPLSFWSDPRMDYGDEHAYLNNAGNPPSSPYHTHSIDDSALSTRQCWEVLKGYGLNKPVVRGETGVFNGGWWLGWYPDLALDTGAVYEHKKLWAHVGLGGYQGDGQWNTTNLRLNNNWKMYGRYERFMAGEPVSNGKQVAIGTDLTGTELIITSESNLRAWGVRDVLTTQRNGITLASPGRVLLWVDNKNHTWRNVVDGVLIAAIGGQLSIPGLPAGDYNAEWWDTASGTVSAAETYTVGAGGTLTLSVDDLATDRAVKLGNGGAGAPSVGFRERGSAGLEAGETLDLVVALSASSSRTVTVDYAANGGSAEAGSDYVFSAGTLTFIPGQTEKAVSLTILDDADDEGDETVEIALRSPINAVMGAGWCHRRVILDNERAAADGWGRYR